jgi:transposase
MANKPISMLQIRRIIQLIESGLSNRKIASQLSISRNTVDYYKKQFRLSEKSYSELSALQDHELSKIVFKEQCGSRKDERHDRLAPQLGHFVSELNRRGVTRYLLWQEYREKDPDGYSYQQFCEHLNTYLDVKNAVMHLEHKPGEKAEIDFAGGKMSYVNQSTGEVIDCPILVAVLPYSGYTYAQALPDASQNYLIPALGQCLEYFQGVPQCVVTDNMKQMVKKTSRYEPSFTDLAEQWSLHYNTTLLATRPARPKDKPTVEKAVDLVYKRVFAPLRNMIFKSLPELNYHIKQCIDKHNDILYQKKEFSRKELFLLEEKELLKPLPLERFDIKYSVKRKVNKDYHVLHGEDQHHYSVPFRYIGKQIVMVYDSDQVEIFYGTDRIALHKRNYRKNFFSTRSEHMPEKHKAYKEALGWTPEYFIEKASKVGPFTKEAITRLTSSRQFTEQTYKSCMGILKLQDKYGKDRLEKASEVALKGCFINYGTISNILLNNRDKMEQEASEQQIPVHENIRGKQSYSIFNN